MREPVTGADLALEPRDRLLALVWIFDLLQHLERLEPIRGEVFDQIDLAHRAGSEELLRDVLLGQLRKLHYLRLTHGAILPASSSGGSVFKTWCLRMPARRAIATAH